MIEEIIMFKTSDGVLHKSEEAAKGHDLDRVREYIDNRFNFMIQNGKMSRSDLFGMILGAIPTYEEASKFIRHLNNLI